MGKKNKRKAGDKIDELYGGEKEYGSWGDSWNEEAKQQQLRASGAYDSGSDLAKAFGKLDKDGSSRVDDDKGWRELAFDKPPKSAEEYQDLISKWSSAGFDVRGIDMDGDFANSNIAVRMSPGNQDTPPPAEPTPDPRPTPGVSSAPVQTINNTGGGGGNMSPTQNVNQDNDITNIISGDGNSVSNTQDNSVTQNNIDNSNNSRYYGGSTRNFSYGGNNIANPYDADPQTPTQESQGYYRNPTGTDFLSKYLGDNYMDIMKMA